MADLDSLVFMLLTRLRHGVDVVPGIDSTMRALLHRSVRPLCVVVAADVSDPSLARIVNEVRVAALSHMVPVVQAMTPQWLGSACKAKRAQFVVTVVSLPNEESRALAAAVMERAAQVCAAAVETGRTADICDVTHLYAAPAGAAGAACPSPSTQELVSRLMRLAVA